MDLSKDYDCVNWTFLQFILIQVGLPILVTNWIMNCITYTIFSILINGSPTYFFNRNRVIRWIRGLKV